MRATALPAVLRCRSIPRSLVRTTVVCRDLTTSSPRRRRPPPSGAKYKLLGQEEQSRQPDRGGLQHAFAPSEDNFDDYLKKASLSPWVPVPDPVARKMLEIAKAGPDDVRDFSPFCDQICKSICSVANTLYRFMSNWVLVMVA